MQIFLSHASEDREIVAQVKTAVGSLATVYCTEDDVQAGVNVHMKIQKQIQKCDLMVVLLTTNGAESAYLHQEIGFAKKAGKLIIPVVSSGVSNHKLGMLEGIEYIKIDEDDDRWLSRLSVRVESLMVDSDTMTTVLAIGVLLVVVGVLVVSGAAGPTLQVATRTLPIRN